MIRLCFGGHRAIWVLTAVQVVDRVYPVFQGIDKGAYADVSIRICGQPLKGISRCLL